MAGAQHSAGAVERVLGMRGLACPLPVLKARRAMREVPAGALLKVRATDPGAPADFKGFCEVTGHRLEDKAEADGVYSFLIQANG